MEQIPTRCGFAPHFTLYNTKIQSFEVIQLYIRHGGDLIIRDYEGATVLHHFVRSGTDPKSLQLLLQNGADVNARDLTGETPLHYFVRRSKLPIELLWALLDAGADVSIDDNESQSKYSFGGIYSLCDVSGPLYEVASAGSVDAARLLLDYGADIHDDNVSIAFDITVTILRLHLLTVLFRFTV